MNELMIIEQREVLEKQLKIYGDFENPLFLAKDVAEWIEYDISSINKMLNNVDNSEKVRKIVPTLGGNQESWFLTEDGLYEMLMQSRKPIAKKFKIKVKQILKDVRKHGMYAKDEILNNPDLLIEVATQLKKEREQRQSLELENSKKDQIIGELKPKADYTDAILQSKALVTITQISKDYGKSEEEMNKILHGLKVQYKQNKQWLLYSNHQAKGYTHSETIYFRHTDGTPDIRMTTKWTQKGRLFLYGLLKKNNIVPIIEMNNIVA